MEKLKDKMKDFKISKKLKTVFIIIILMLIMTVIASVAGFAFVGRNFTSFYKGPYQNTNKVMEMRRAIQSYSKYINYAFTISDEVKSEEYVNSAKEELESIKDDLDYLKDNFLGDMTLVNKFIDTIENSKNYKEQIYELALDNDNDGAREIFFKEYQPALVKANECLESIYNQSQEIAANKHKKSIIIQIIAISILIIISASAIGITITLALYITKSLTNPILEIETSANKMAEGDFDVELNYHSKDELGLLSDSMRCMIKVTNEVLEDTARGLREIANGNFDIEPNAEFIGIFEQIRNSINEIIMQFTDTISQINEASNQVSGGSNQLAEGSQSLAEGASEQASAIEELSASIGEITNKVQDTVRITNDVNNMAHQSVTVVNDGNGSMKKMINAMEDIEKASINISSIIKDIESIATETNLLALNASIEAARAGDAGKGFAVVADKVKELSQQSGEAVKKTVSLIEKSINSVEYGKELAGNTAIKLEKVVDSVNKSTELISEIARSSEEQAQSIEQINDGIQQITEVVQSNSAISEESAAASQELTAQAINLNNMISEFKLKKL